MPHRQTNTLLQVPTLIHDDKSMRASLESTRGRQCSNQGTNTRNTFAGSASSARVLTTNEPEDHQTGEPTLGHRGRRIISGWYKSFMTGNNPVSDTLKRYQGPEYENWRNPVRSYKRCREPDQLGYSDTPKTTSTNAHSQTTRQSSSGPSNPNFPRRALADPHASGTSAVPLHSDSQLPDNPEAIPFSLSLSDCDPLDRYDCGISTGTVGWDVATYLREREDQANFEDTE